jgi:hypothetical protein
MCEHLAVQPGDYDQTRLTMRIRVYPQYGYNRNGFNSPAARRREARALRRQMRNERRQVNQLRWMMASAARPMAMPFAQPFASPFGYNGVSPFQSPFQGACNGAAIARPWGMGMSPLTSWSIAPRPLWGMGSRFGW